MFSPFAKVDRNLAPVSVVILTYNEEPNLPLALASVKGWSDDVHVVDSFSTDRTVEVAKRAGANVVGHRFESYADQRNWAMESLPLKHQWVLFLDADEQLTPAVRDEVRGLAIADDQAIEGVHLPYDYYFMGRPLKKAMHPHLRLVRRHARWKKQGPWREFSTITKPCPTLKNRLIHDCQRGMGAYVSKLVRNAAGDANRLYARRHEPDDADRNAGREMKLRHRGWDVLERRLPPLARALAFFVYNLAARLEPRAGLPGLFFLFIYGLWYPILVDANYVEIRRQRRAGKGTRQSTSETYRFEHELRRARRAA